MKKIIRYCLIAGLAVNMLILPALVFALDQPAAGGSGIINLLNEAAGDTGAGYNTSQDVAETGLARIVGSVARAVISLLGVIFISYTIYGGYLWMTARGNDENISKAKNTIRDGIIGMIIILAAGAIYLTVRELLLSGTSAGPAPSI